MTRGRAGLLTLVMTALVLLAVYAGRPSAQTPRYSPPRTAAGHPDLQGVWQALNSAAWNLEDHSGQLGIPPGLSVVEGGDIPYKPEALAQRKKNFEQRATADPVAQCRLPGVPRATYLPFPFQIIQNADSVIIAHEYVNANRQIYTSGGLHGNHPEGWDGMWMGDSRGRWEGDTLVVDVANFTDQTWFDASGNYHSDQLHVVERFTRTGPDHMRYEATIEDPRVFSRPWKISMPLYRRQEPRARLLEYFCPHDIDVAKAQKHAEGKK
jgi:hypothetical protein